LKNILIALLSFFISNLLYSQTGIVTGVIKNTEGELLNNVSINYQKKGTVTDAKGFYELEIPQIKK